MFRCIKNFLVRGLFRQSFRDGVCKLFDDVVYKCGVTRPLPKKLYLRLVEGEWKSRINNQKLSFKHKRYFNRATLLSYMSHLKSVSSEKPNVKWCVLRYIPPYSNISKNVSCVYRKYWKQLSNPERTFNKLS